MLFPIWEQSESYLSCLYLSLTVNLASDNGGLLCRRQLKFRR